MAQAPDIQAKRLNKNQLQANFADLHPPLDHHEALVESDRCYFCADAPCQQACPTSIDIPMFIREIQAGHPQRRRRPFLTRTFWVACVPAYAPPKHCVKKLVYAKPLRASR